MIYLIVTIILVLLDQATKLLALTKLKPVGNITVIPGFFDFTFVENRGAAFGILHRKRFFFIILTIIIVLVIIYEMKKMPVNKEYNKLRWAFTLIISGAIGNLIDRIIRGYVVDFFEFTFIDYPVFNVADIFVVIGALFMAFLVIFVIKEEKKEDKK